VSLDASMPSYEKLFGDLVFRDGDEARSVYSPAAYLADLLDLLRNGDGDSDGDDDSDGDSDGDDATGGAARELLSRRPDIAAVPLDAEHTYAELPYLDIVNEVLERELRAGGSKDAYQLLAALRHPFTLPFSLPHQRLRRILGHLQVDPVDLYRQFAEQVDPDVVAREFLGLTPAEVRLLTTVLADGPCSTVGRSAFRRCRCCTGSAGSRRPWACRWPSCSRCSTRSTATRPPAATRPCRCSSTPACKRSGWTPCWPSGTSTPASGWCRPWSRSSGGCRPAASAAASCTRSSAHPHHRRHPRRGEGGVGGLGPHPRPVRAQDILVQKDPL
jgi:hypothetical protein